MTPERRLMLLEKIRARRVARIAVGLPTDALEPEKELEEEEEDFEEEGMSRRRRMWGALATRICGRSSRPSSISSGRSRLRRQDTVTGRIWRRKRPWRRRR